ncbi:hypothetical protein [Streptomyces sp. NPDC006879]|uniref:hypothetical protein n=1 Tax=Streptomyces sp. NPDC006879 TaxID=3364767 RepID=UPI003694E7C7
MPKASTVVCGLAVAVLVSSGGLAVAAEPDSAAGDTSLVETAAPAQPEEGDLVEGAPISDAPAPSETEKQVEKSPDAVPPRRGCEAGWRYYASAKGKDYHKGVGAEQANYNRTSRTAKSTFTSEVAGTVGVAVSGELKVGVSVALTSVESKFGVDVSAQLTTKIGNRISVDTPSRKTTHARYGVYRLKSTGYSQYVYVDCGQGAKKPVTLYTPRRLGWYIWES